MGCKVVGAYLAFISVFMLQFWDSCQDENILQNKNRRDVLKIAYEQSTNRQCEVGELSLPCPGEIQSAEMCVEQGCCWDPEESSCLAFEGMLRLHDGVSHTSGRLEIFHNDQWGTVCDDGWSEKAAEVACFQMGFSNSRPETEPGFYHTVSTGPIFLDNLECIGDESMLLECGHSPVGESDCEHGEDIGLMCESLHPSGEVRLVGGPDAGSGRVEIYYNGRFGTICDDSWDHFSADVVCRQLGYDSGWPVGGAFFGPGDGTIWLDEVYCSGGESSIDSCRHQSVGHHDCTHAEDAGVICDVATEMLFKEGEIRLVGSSENKTGIVEIYHAGSWGKVCAKQWSDTEADLVCRQLGFVTGSVSNEIYNPSQGTISGWLIEVSCTGAETQLQSCKHGLWNHYDCSSEVMSAVQCDDTVEEIIDLEEFPPVIADLRLAGSDDPHKGRVEVLINGKYGTLCDDGFDNNAAAVICRSLGYVAGVTVPAAIFGPGDGPIWLDDVFCSGNETRLEECSHRDWGTHDCSHKEDAAVMCQLGEDIPDEV